jgi:hypothetical protein
MPINLRVTVVGKFGIEPDGRLVPADTWRLSKILGADALQVPLGTFANYNPSVELCPAH